MAAPAVTDLGTPELDLLDDGFPCCVVFASLPNLPFYETGVKPFGADGGKPIDRTNMRTKRLRQMAPGSLIKVDDMTITFEYHPKLITDVIAANGLLNKTDAMTVHWPPTRKARLAAQVAGNALQSKGAKQAVWAFVQKIDLKELKENTPAEGTMTVTITNTDPNTGSEELPVFVPEPGA